MIDEKVIDKIQKALALAADSPTDSEAQAAMLAVQRLLIRHNLTMADVEAINGKEKNVTSEFVSDISGRIPWWKKSLANVVSQNFRCKVYIDRLGSYQGGLKFLGLEEDVEVAKAVYQYAERIVDSLATKYVQKQYRQKKPTKGVRNIYIAGFIGGLKEQFKEQIEKNNWGLVLVTDALVIKAEEELGLVKPSGGGIKPKFSNNNDAWEEGFAQGKEFGSEKKSIEE